MARCVDPMDRRLTLFASGAVHVTDVECVRSHSAQAWKLVVAVEGEIAFQSNGQRGTTRVLVVPPYVEQALEGSGITVAFFGEPGMPSLPYTPPRAGLSALSGTTASRLVGLARATARAPSTHATDAAHEAFSALELPAQRPPERRVRLALDATAAASAPAIADVATMLGISEVRLRHLVHDATGLSLRTHRLWHRTMHALDAVVAGNPLAQAAADTGFADQSHFTRAFVRFFGRTPSSIQGTVTRLHAWSPPH